MLSSIHPFGERSRNSRFALTVTAYLAGSVLGGLTIGALAGVLAEGVGRVLPARGALAVLAALTALALLTDLGRTPWSRPSWHRQVNEVWLTTYRGWVYGLGFGFQLGLGVVTIVTTSLVWLFLAAAVLTGEFLIALVLGVVFGLARGLFILSTARIDGPDALRRLHRRIAAGAAIVQRAALTAMVAGFVTLGAALVVGLGT